MRTSTSIMLMYISQASILIAVFFISWLINQELGEFAFSQYSLFRRGVTFIAIIAGLGITVAAPRILADRILHYNGKKYQVPSIVAKEYALTISLLMLITITVIFLIQPQTVAKILLGKQASFSFGLAALTFILSYYTYLYVFELLRIMNKFYAVFILQIGYFIIIPVLAILLNKQLDEMLLSTFIFTWIWVCLFVPYLAKEFTNTNHNVAKKQGLYYFVKHFIYYFPVPLIMLALLTLPSFIVLHMTGDTVKAGYMAFSTSLISSMGQMITPFNIVMRGRMRFMHIDTKNGNQLYLWWNRGMIALFFFILAGSLVLYFFGAKLLIAYFSPTILSSDNLKIILLSLWCIPGYMVFLFCYGFVEASLEKHELITIVTITAVFFGISLIIASNYGLYAIIFSQVGAYVLLGGLMSIQIIKSRV